MHFEYQTERDTKLAQNHPSTSSQNHCKKLSQDQTKNQPLPSQSHQRINRHHTYDTPKLSPYSITQDRHKLSDNRHINHQRSADIKQSQPSNQFMLSTTLDQFHDSKLS